MNKIKKINVAEKLQKVKNKICLENMDIDDVINYCCGNIDADFYELARDNVYIWDEDIEKFACEHPEEIRDVELFFPEITDAIAISTTAQEFFNQAQLQAYREQIFLACALDYCLKVLNIKEITPTEYKNIKAETDYASASRFTDIFDMVKEIVEK